MEHGDQIKNFSAIHSIRFADDGTFTCWRYHGVGQGKTSSVPGVRTRPDYRSILDFPMQFPAGSDMLKKSGQSKVSVTSVKLCPEATCTETFESNDQLDSHIRSGEHTVSKMSWRDVVKTSIIRLSHADSLTITPRNK